ncbi:unnamed protein product [Rotaria sordida]|uniref:Cytochrome P450 n=1 Tax=Rotaria sordida TaxID=392033 RepID=A0A815I6U0_9BILA|nr:unnamed protein product [Rotaria sordida]CAF1523847.1 unnamed protein product [Rotaria sordida]CAF3756760.1 unnamed protein product [Rotaria sordida]CAF4150344.1 unnamed protein product [Rotaria sordida]
MPESSPSSSSSSAEKYSPESLAPLATTSRKCLNKNAQRDLSIEKLDSLIYLDCVIKEVLCYSPPFTETYRTLTTDNYLPTSGAKLFKGDQIFITIYNLAIDTELWSIDLNQFYPKRFLDQD